MTDSIPELDRAFDPERFRDVGHELVNTLADYLVSLRSPEAGGDATVPVLDPVKPDVLERRVEPVSVRSDLKPILDAALQHSNHLHHPGYIGHQVATVLPTAALVEAFNALLNNGMAVYEMGQMQTAMERRVVQFLAAKLGFGPDADGVMTHGGSVGNLTALLAARQAKCGHDVWTDGQAQPLAVLVSEQAHYCVQRAVQVMGWGAGGAVAIESDERFRMRPERLGPTLERVRASGRRVIAVVASSCTTATGSFDPIDELADFCAREDLWLHVDGAHGASLALSARYREPALRGVERADSVVWDLHKMMMLPALSTAVLFRDGRHGYSAFAQRASYLFADGQASHERDWHDVGKRTLECTKRAMGLTAYAMLRANGVEMFEAHVDRLIDRAREFARRIDAASDFELAVQPECNIVCFRVVPAPALSAPELDRHQSRVRARVVAGGGFYIVQTRLRDESVWLRVTVMNPATSDDYLAALLEDVRSCSRSVLEG